MRTAYLLGLALGPFVILAAIYAANVSGPETCELRNDVVFHGHRVEVEACTGRLGLATRDPVVVARLD